MIGQAAPLIRYPVLLKSRHAREYLEASGRARSIIVAT